jgi:hypothetical protein
VRRAILSGRSWPVTPLTLTRRSTLQRWRCSALRMPQHWMLPKARVRLNNLFNDGIAEVWSSQARTPRPRLSPLTSDPVVHILRWRLRWVH